MEITIMKVCSNPESEILEKRAFPGCVYLGRLNQESDATVSKQRQCKNKTMNIFNCDLRRL